MHRKCQEGDCRVHGEDAPLITRIRLLRPGVKLCGTGRRTGLRLVPHRPADFALCWRQFLVILGFRLHNPARVTGMFMPVLPGPVGVCVVANAILQIRVVISSMSLQMRIIISSIFCGV